MHEKDPTIENRGEFVALISSMMKKAKLFGEMIFDTPIHHETEYAHRSEEPPLTVLYAPNNLEADDLIVEKLYAVNKPQDYIVVTSDRALGFRVKEVEGKVMKVNAFLSLMQKSNRKKKAPLKPSGDTKTHLERLEKVFIKRLEDASE